MWYCKQEKNKSCQIPELQRQGNHFDKIPKTTDAELRYVFYRELFGRNYQHSKEAITDSENFM